MISSGFSLHELIFPVKRLMQATTPMRGTLEQLKLPITTDSVIAQFRYHIAITKAQPFTPQPIWSLVSNAMAYPIIPIQSTHLHVAGSNEFPGCCQAGEHTVHLATVERLSFENSVKACNIEKLCSQLTMCTVSEMAVSLKNV